jgi:Fe-S cluster biogenesis protein NfuA
MPKIAEIEYTPNPNAVKFVLKEAVAVGFPKSFPTRALAGTDPLAQALFDTGQVTSVYMQDKWLTVTKLPTATWSDLLPLLAPPIRQAPAAGGAGAAPAAHRELPGVDPTDPILIKAKQVLEENILPALAADGGGLEIVGRHDKQILIRYMGACGSCPASLTGTLVAIEGLLQKEIDPELVVISV